MAKRIQSKNNKIASTVPLRARSHVLRLLGDELIGNDQLAVFELVKNSYDADATCVTVKLDIGRKDSRLVVTDDGSGMDLYTLKRGWLELGSDLKRGENRSRTPFFNRMPLGEKGVGRLAAFKLGDSIKVISKKKYDAEYYLNIELPDIDEGSTYLEEKEISIFERESPKTFRESDSSSHGTKIIVNRLHNPDWSKRKVRNLKRMIGALNSPFDTPDSFEVLLEVPGHEDWTRDMYELDDLLEAALWQYHFVLEKDGSYSWSYIFKPPSRFRKLKKMEMEDQNAKLPWCEEIDASTPKSNGKDSTTVVSEGDLEGIGRISGSLYLYDRRSKVLSETGGTTQVRQFLDEQTGVRVYRDGIRVYNYGEPGDDWLGLNQARVNKPARTMSTSSVIGAVHLNLHESEGLEEKTNREGFNENETFQRFRLIVQSIVEHLDITRMKDRKALDDELSGKGSDYDRGPGKFANAVSSLRSTLEKKGLNDNLSQNVSTIEKEYEKLRTVTTNAGMSGMNLALVFHEVEKGVSNLGNAVKNGIEYSELSNRIQGLVDLLDGFAPVVKRSTRGVISASSLLKKIVAINRHRFKAHNIVYSCPILDNEDPDFDIQGEINLFIGALNNLIDNSIYWTRRRRDEEESGYKPAISIRTSTEWDANGPIIAVIDNGPGFDMDDESAFDPFMSTRPGGMGLGLYYVRLVMESSGGAAIVANPAELNLPKVWDGSCVFLRFKRS